MYNFPAEYESNTCLRNAGDQYGFESQAIVRASQLYEMARLKNFFTRLWARLLGRSSKLLDLSDMNTPGKPWNAYWLGNQSVPLRHIRGSESRAQDFDAHFNPAQKKNRERWLTIAQIILMGGYLPAIELVKVGDTYFVRDGHHRVSVARAVGQHYIDAVVTVLQFNERVSHDPASLTVPVSLGCLCEERI